MPPREGGVRTRARVMRRPDRVTVRETANEPARKTDSDRLHLFPRVWRRDQPRLVLLLQTGHLLGGYSSVFSLIVTRPLAATESKAPTGEPMPDAA